MLQERKAPLLLPGAGPKAAAIISPLRAEAASMHSPAQILELVNRFMHEKGLAPQRENFIKLNSMSANSKTSPQKSVPWLSLRGIWLQNAGFAPYEYAKTIACNGMLIVIPGLHPPVVNHNDLRHLNTLLQKLNHYVHPQK